MCRKTNRWVNIPLASCRRRLRYWWSTWQGWWHSSDLRSHRSEHSSKGGFRTTGYYSHSVYACLSRFAKQTGDLWRVEIKLAQQTCQFYLREENTYACTVLFGYSSVLSCFLWFPMSGCSGYACSAIQTLFSGIGWNGYLRILLLKDGTQLLICTPCLYLS